jgi:hypothetical protein
MNITKPKWIQSTGASRDIPIPVQPVSTAIPKFSMKKTITGFFILFLCFNAFAQKSGDIVTGKVSFISSQNIYVKFQSTSGLSVGDTLFSSSGTKRIPVLIVSNLSSTSCVCSTISANPPAIGDIITGRQKPVAPDPVKKHEEKETKAIPVVVVKDSANIKSPGVEKRKQRIRGSISAIAYSSFSNTLAKNSNNYRYNFNLDARNIGNSKFSAETYISFRHKAGEWEVVKNNIFSALKIYNLAISYDPGKSTHITIGRKINPEISGVGAVDGIQASQSFHKFVIGGLAGFRPDYTDYGFNSNLLQYGGWLGFNSAGDAGYFNNALAIVQQTNNGKTDRRFLSFNHSSSLSKKLSLVGSFEVDLYAIKDSLPANVFDLTSMYFSLRYRITDNFSLSGSYDSRKNIYYYETYKSSIDLAIENEMRKSFRLSANYRITDDIVLGIDGGYRFLKSDPNQSKNVSGYFTYSRMPLLNLTTTLTASYLESNYLKGKIFGASVSRDLFSGKLQLSGGYRYIDYNYTESTQTSLQNIGEANLSWQFLKTMSLSVNYELTFEKSDKYNRLYLQLRKRF